MSNEVCSSFEVGESVQVWSNSTAAWENCVIELICTTEVIVDGFKCPNGTIKVSLTSGAIKFITSDKLASSLRKMPLPSVVSGAPGHPLLRQAPEGLGFAAGERVQVLSASQGKWVDGRVDRVCVCKTQVNGYDCPPGTIVTSITGDRVKFVAPEQVATSLRKVNQPGSAVCPSEVSRGDCVEARRPREQNPRQQQRQAPQKGYPPPPPPPPPRPPPQDPPLTDPTAIWQRARAGLLQFVNEQRAASSPAEKALNFATWTAKVFCAGLVPALSASKDSDDHTRYLPVRADVGGRTLGLMKWTHMTGNSTFPSAPQQLLRPIGHLRIKTMEEHRQKFWGFLPQDQPLYHAFVLLELEHDWHLCTERYNDKLEVMCGRGSLARLFMEQYRSTGDERRVDDCFGLEPELVSSDASVATLLDWIDGRLAKRWQPYDFLQANCQHYAQEVQELIRAGIQATNRMPAFANIQLLIVAVSHAGMSLELVDDEFKDNEAVVEAAVRNCGSALQYASGRLKHDLRIARAAVEQYGGAWEFVPTQVKEHFTFKRDWNRFQQNAAIVLDWIKQDGAALKYASEVLTADRNFILEAVRVSGVALQYAPDVFKCDSEVVARAVHSCPRTLTFASNELRGNADFMSKVLSTTGRALKFAPGAIRDQGALALVAIRQDPLALTFASPRLAEDVSFVLEAVSVNARAFRYAPRQHKHNRTIALAAVQQEGSMLELASPALKEDREVVLTAVGQRGTALRYASFKLRADRNFMLTVVQKKGWLLEFAADELKQDRGVVMAAVRSQGNALRSASEELQGDREVVQLAVKSAQWGGKHALCYASKQLQEDMALVSL